MDQKKHLKFQNESPLHREKPSGLEGPFLIFHFFLLCMISYYRVLFFSNELNYWAMIDTTIRFKDTLLKDTDLDSTPQKRRWKLAFSDLIGCSVFTFLMSLMRQVFLMAFYAVSQSAGISLWQLCSIAIWRKSQQLRVLTDTPVIWFPAIDFCFLPGLWWVRFKYQCAI